MIRLSLTRAIDCCCFYFFFCVATLWRDWKKNVSLMCNINYIFLCCCLLASFCASKNNETILKKITQFHKGRKKEMLEFLLYKFFFFPYFSSSFDYLYLLFFLFHPPRHSDTSLPITATYFTLLFLYWFYFSSQWNCPQNIIKWNAFALIRKAVSRHKWNAKFQLSINKCNKCENVFLFPFFSSLHHILTMIGNGNEKFFSLALVAAFFLLSFLYLSFNKLF